MGLFKKSYDQINVNEIDDIQRPKIIDVRTKGEYSSMPSKNTKNIEMQTLLANPEQFLDKDTHYYILCLSGARSGSVCSFLSKQGYHVTNLKGGFGSYSNKYLRR